MHLELVLPRGGVDAIMRKNSGEVQSLANGGEVDPLFAAHLSSFHFDFGHSVL